MTSGSRPVLHPAWEVRDPAERMEELLTAEAEDRLPRLLLFWGHRARGADGPGRACLSQWWPSPLTVDGVGYASAEHWMMAGKARVFGDDEALADVLAAPTPGAAKAVGARVRGFDEERWTAVRYGLVVAGNHAKFSQHPDLGAYLARTGSQVLVEASPVDRVWGVGWASDAVEVTRPSLWRGLNLLGFALMEVRGRLVG